MKRFNPVILLLLCVSLAAAALADDQQVYKWTDAQGVLHYSDKPPQATTADVQTMTVQISPPVDPVKQAQAQAILMASAAAMQQNEDAAELRRRQAAAQEAQYAATLAALQQQQDDAGYASLAYPIYFSSPLVPRTYRRNLYVPRRYFGRNGGSGFHAVSGRPVGVLPGKP